MVSVKYKMCGRSDNILVLVPQIILFLHIKPHYVIVSRGVFAHVTPLCLVSTPTPTSAFTLHITETKNIKME